MPAPVYFRGQRLPASYANFYIANKLVLVPVFNDPNDRVALNTLADAFPEREIVGIYCRRLHLGTGRAALHDAAATGGVTKTIHHGGTGSQRDAKTKSIERESGLPCPRLAG